MTIWRDRRAGEIVVADLSEPDGYGEAAVLIAAPEATDWVKLPLQVDPGQRQRRVLERFRKPCPICGQEVLHFRVEGAWYVAECAENGFVVYRLDGRSVAEALAGEA